MDVVFLIDATGSMSSSLRAAHDRAAELAIKLRVESPDVDFQFGSVCYRDPVDSHGDVHEVHALSGDIDALVDFLARVRATGGGDGPEDWIGAYGLALDSIAWRGGAKLIVHIADAPAHGGLYCGHENHEEESAKLAPLIERVAKQGIVVTALNLNSGATRSFAECEKVYREAGGRRFAIETFAIANSYGDVRRAESRRMEAEGLGDGGDALVPEMLSHRETFACFACADESPLDFEPPRVEMECVCFAAAAPDRDGAWDDVCMAPEESAPPPERAEIGERIEACTMSGVSEALGFVYE